MLNSAIYDIDNPLGSIKPAKSTRKMLCKFPKIILLATLITTYPPVAAPNPILGLVVPHVPDSVASPRPDSVPTLENPEVPSGCSRRDAVPPPTSLEYVRVCDTK